MRSETWRNAAAFGTWLVVALPQLVGMADGRIGGRGAVVWLGAFIVFGLALTPCLLLNGAATRRRLFLALLLVQTAAGLTMVAASANGTASATLVIVAAEVASLFPPVVTWLWVGIQSVLITLVWARFADVPGAIALGGAFGGFQAFAASTVALARSERAAREDLARAHRELLTTRSLLAENSRVAERLRIARDLHDTLGHHLTALSIQLDVASRLTSGQAAAHVEEAHAVARLLLSDVRSVVSEMRDRRQIDLAEALRALAVGTRSLDVQLETAGALEVEDAAQADALLRSVQEIITNATRHAAASHLSIRIERTAEGIELWARDDGRGASHLVWGNGLRGMRERFTEFAGRVDVTSKAGQGFEVHAFMPQRGATT